MRSASARTSGSVVIWTWPLSLTWLPRGESARSISRARSHYKRATSSQTMRASVRVDQSRDSVCGLAPLTWTGRATSQTDARRHQKAKLPKESLYNRDASQHVPFTAEPIRTHSVRHPPAHSRWPYPFSGRLCCDSPAPLNTRIVVGTPRDRSGVYKPPTHGQCIHVAVY